MSAVRRWGVLGNLQEWSSHCYFSGNLGAPAGPKPGSFPPLYLLSAALWRPGVEAGKRTFRNSADVVFPRKERFSGQRQSLYLSKPDSQGSKLGPWQTATGAIIWQMRLGISEAAEELWVPGNSTLRQAGGGTQSKPPLLRPHRPWLYFLGQGTVLWPPRQTWATWKTTLFLVFCRSICDLHIVSLK